MTTDQLRAVFADLPEEYRHVLLMCAEWGYDSIREHFAPGDGTASPEQERCGQLIDALTTDSQQTQAQADVAALEDSIAATMSNFGVTGIRFGDGPGEHGFDWDPDGTVRRD